MLSREFHARWRREIVLAVVIAMIAAVPPTIAVVMTWRSNSEAIQRVHVDINSRMDELLKSFGAEKRAEGYEAGRKEGEKTDP